MPGLMLTECTPPAGEAPKNGGNLGPTGLVSHRLQGRGFALPGGLPALGPEDSRFSRRRPGKDLDDEVFAGTKELQGDAKAQNSLEACLQGQRGFPAAKGADAVLEGGLTPLTFALHANRNPHQNEAAVGRELA